MKRLILTLISFCQQVENEVQSAVLLGDRCNAGQFWFSPNTLTASTTGRRMLKPYHTHCHISPQMNAVILGVHVDAWDPFLMSRSRAHCVQASSVYTGIPSSTYYRRRVAAGCRTASGSSPRVSRCLGAMKAVREGECVISFAVSRAVATMVSTIGSTGGG